METQNIKSREPLSSFIRYCVTHPELRFWQALRNWSGYSFILTSNRPPYEWEPEVGNRDASIVDTFNWEGRRHDEKS